jgi:hypothetical protein
MLLISLALLAASPAPSSSVDAGPAFERLKKLEGNWKSKDLWVSFRVITGGAAVVETVTAGADKSLVSVTVFRVEAGELVATVDADTHQALKATSASGSAMHFEGKGVALTLGMKDADNLHRESSTKAAKADFTREYVDTLK